MAKRRGVPPSPFKKTDRRITVTIAVVVVLLLLGYWHSNYTAALLKHNEYISSAATTHSSTRVAQSSTSFPGIESWYRELVTRRLQRCHHTSAFFHYFLPHKQCRTPERFGKCGDGAKWICLDMFQGKNSKRAAARNEKCVVYSFGSSDDSCFETAVAERLDCEIHIFDPTSSELKDDRWTYHSYGLGGGDPTVTGYWNWRTQKQSNCTDCPMKNLREIMKELNHEHVDILKVDIDGAEWRSFEYIYKTIKTLPADQLQIELTGLDVTPLTDSLAGGYEGNIAWWDNVLNDGFKVFELEPNYGTCGYRSKNRSVSVEYAMWR